MQGQGCCLGSSESTVLKLLWLENDYIFIAMPSPVLLCVLFFSILSNLRELAESCLGRPMLYELIEVSSVELLGKCSEIRHVTTGFGYVLDCKLTSSYKFSLLLSI